MAGFYSQSFSMIRQMFEIWQRLEYVALMPENAYRWFHSGPSGNICPPSEGTIQRALVRSKDKHLKASAGIVEQNMKYLDKFAHPSEYLFQQTVSDDPGRYNVRGNYGVNLCHMSNHDGVSAFRMALSALTKFSGCTAWFVLEMNEISSICEKAIGKACIDIDSYRESVTDYPHWILGKPQP